MYGCKTRITYFINIICFHHWFEVTFNCKRENKIHDIFVACSVIVIDAFYSFFFFFIVAISFDDRSAKRNSHGERKKEYKLNVQPVIKLKSYKERPPNGLSLLLSLSRFSPRDKR